jgi:hypothetical protein
MSARPIGDCRARSQGSRRPACGLRKRDERSSVKRREPWPGTAKPTGCFAPVWVRLRIGIPANWVTLLDAKPMSDLAGADHLVGALLVQRPNLDDLPPVAMKAPGGGDRRVETIRRANAVTETVSKEHVPTRRNH